MSEQNKEANNGMNFLANNPDRSSVGPKEFLARYLKYLPWIVVTTIVFLIMAYLRIRYSTPIYRVQSSLLIKDESNRMGAGGSDKDLSFNQLFMNQGSVNLYNEVQILRSRPVLQRVARDLDLQEQDYNRGSIRSSLQYDNKPFNLIVRQMADSTTGFGFQVNVISDTQFLLNDQKAPANFGHAFQVGRNICVLYKNPTANLNLYQSKVFLVNWLTMPDVAEQLLGQVSVNQPGDQATILTLGYQGENITLGKDVLNTLMAVYDSLIVEDKSRIAFITLRFIDDRLNNIRDELNGVQGNLKNYMVNNQVYNLEDQSKDYLENLSAGTRQK